MIVGMNYSNGSAAHTMALGLYNMSAATVGMDSAQGLGTAAPGSSCQTVYSAASEPIKVEYAIEGSPSPMPTFTYWYTVTQL